MENGGQVYQEIVGGLQRSAEVGDRNCVPLKLSWNLILSVMDLEVGLWEAIGS